MNAAIADHSIDADRATAAPAPNLILVRAQEQPAATAGPARASGESMREVWRINGIVLTRFALKLTLGNIHRAEDIVQETLLRAWRHPEIVDGHAETIRPWLFTVARNVAIDLWRMQSRRDDIIEDRPVDRPNPVQDIDQAMTAMDVRAALAQLTPEHRQVVVEVYYLGRSVAEIAELLGIPEGTVKSRTYYALRQLKRLLTTESEQPVRPASAPFPRALTA
jgi:RNA polymerase sigma-70 factor, ECF subfamily